jgi:AAA family ATP:ADP antiporter
VNGSDAAEPPAEATRALVSPTAEDRRRGESALLGFAAAYHFFLMAAYFILKPLREEMGVRSGRLELLWLGTLTTSLVLLPPYWKLVGALPRERFIPIVYRAIAASLVGFFALFRWLPPEGQLWVARAFYVWISVFNLLVLTVFWGFMADVFSPSQGRRLFGYLAAGGTVGALAGSQITLQLVRQVGTIGLLLVSTALLEGATQCALAFARRAPRPGATAQAAGPRRSPARDWIAGLRLFLRSPYLLGVAGYLFLSTFASSYAYALRTHLMRGQMSVSEERTAVFAWSEFVTQGLAFAGQVLLSGRLLRAIGTGATLAIQMGFAAAGFGLLAWSLGAAQAPGEGAAWWRWLGLDLEAPTAGLLAIVLFFALLKAIEFGLSKPARESLFTVATREEKYQSKSLIDTGLYRGFDQIHIVSFSRLHASEPLSLGLSSRACALVAAPILLAGLLLSRWLGRKQAELASRAPRES